MTADPLVITLAILGIAAFLFITERLRPDLIALVVVVALGLTGVLTPREAFSGFSSSAVTTIFAIFILAEGLRISGVTEQAGQLLLRVAGNSERHLVVVVMIAGAILSLFMNNIAAAAVLLPAVSGAARRSNVSPGRLLMPLAFATILGGMATLFTTTNIVVSGLLRNEGLRGYSVIDFAPVGIPMVVLGVAYMTLWGRRLLRAQPPVESLNSAHRRQKDLTLVYRLDERLFRARIPAGSDLIGRCLSETALRESYGLNVVAIERPGHFDAQPMPCETLCEGDIMLLEGRLEELGIKEPPPQFEVLPAGDWRSAYLKSPEVVFVEAILAPRSAWLGQTLRTLHLREKYGFSALGIWRAGRPIRYRLPELVLEFGDALLLQGPVEQIPILRTEADLILMGNGIAVGGEQTTLPPKRGRLALAFMLGALVLAGFFPTLIAEILLGAVILMVLSKILTMDQVYSATEWRSVFLVGGMLPLGLALTKSGAARLIASSLVSLLGPAGPLALLAGLFLLTMLLTQTMHGAVVASALAPVAIQAAQQANLDPRALAMGVALATSMAFLTPLGHPVNVLVMGPGGYSFRDFLRVGFPLTLLLFALVMVLMPVFWPLR